MIRTRCSSTADPIVLHDVEQNPDEARGFGKPCGFWYEVNGDWRRWMQNENFGLEYANHLFAVELGSCNVLKINTLKKLDQLSATYSRPARDPSPLGKLVASTYERIGAYMDWERLATEYDGLEIAPYQWPRRLAEGFLWYYGWDCASGVIWRPRDATVTYLHPLHLEAVDLDAELHKEESIG